MARLDTGRGRPRRESRRARGGRRPAEAPPARVATGSAAPPGRRTAAAISLALLVSVAWVFSPALDNDFVNLDDPLYVTANPHVQAGLTWDSVRWAFTTVDLGFWHPLAWLSLLLDSQLFGLRPAGFHLTSLLLHAATTVLLFLAFRRLTGAVWRSATVAALFAFHPLHVETVAWVSDRKDLLAGLLCALALLAHAARAEGAGSPGWRLAPASTAAAFAGALMSKATVLTLPLVLLVLDWWPLRRLEGAAAGARAATARRLVGEKWPLFALAVAAAAVSLVGQRAAGALPTTAQYPAPLRVMNALLAYLHYLAQTLWPSGLAPYYPAPATFSLWATLGAGALLLALSAAAAWTAPRRPYLAAGWLWYVVLLLPASGLLQVGTHARADRYTYLPLVGVLWLLTWAACDLAGRWRHRSVALAAAGAVVVVACMVASRQQLARWRDSETLFRHTLAVTTGNELAHNNLATALARQGRLDEAVAHLEEAIRLVPDYAGARNNLGTALGRQGRLEAALPHLEEAVRLAPGDADFRSNLADALFLTGRLDAAVGQYQEALRLRPGDQAARQKLAVALERQRQTTAPRP